MINQIDTFVQKYKKVIQNHIDVYSNEENPTVKYNIKDFDTTKLDNQIDKTDNLFLTGLLKQAHDTIKCYERSFAIKNQTREDYYRYAQNSLKQDLLIIDVIVNHLNTTYDKVDLLYVTPKQES